MLIVRQALVRDDGYKRRNPDDIDGVRLHRFGERDESWWAGVGARPSPEGVAKFFREHPDGVAATGGPMPYAIVIDFLGQAWQAAPLSWVTPHTKGHNRTTIGVAVMGNFTRHEPTVAQRKSTAWLLAGLLAWRPDLTIVGHTDTPNATNTPGKVCPGALLGMGVILDEAEEIRQQRATKYLAACGMEL